MPENICKSKSWIMRFFSREMLTFFGICWTLSALLEHIYPRLLFIVFWGSVVGWISILLNWVPQFIRTIQKKYPRISVYLQCYGVCDCFLVFFLFVFYLSMIIAPRLAIVFANNPLAYLYVDKIDEISIAKKIVPFFVATYIVFVRKKQKPEMEEHKTEVLE